MVKLSHTIFGLPFTLASAALAHRWAVEHGDPGVTWLKLALIVLAFTGARTAAMGFNRIVDRDVDAENPRTATRELPAGTVGLRSAWTLTLASAGVFVGAAALLGWLPFVLSPVCLAIVFGYSFFKRFSAAAHMFLGLALALAPGGAWIAVTGDLTGWPIPVLLMGAVATWVAGFDVLYSLQDEEFDRSRGLHSIPAALGTRGAVVVSALLHVGTVALLGSLHVVAGLGWGHVAGVAGVTGILVYEHWLVGPGDLSKIDRAFFDLNGYVSIGYLAALLIDLLVL